ncbi:VacJ family lipoprotein [Duganella sp. HH101]|uniref:MlaA family lipoprotein n=1 Tax=Duganella sp. HH101 TaxID=1781066 RepID=UPI0008735E50|nr:VacJ family lipoprotein [Duganella sp. HH101]OFA05560.1 putative phospholipid-binding lipoprotein MlaA precursor [Duganella sp. HH101]
MTHRTPQHLRRAALALGVTVLLAGCAGPNPRDPYEGFNRAMFSFNDTVDTYALKPAATAYRNVLPNFVQTGVNNFFGNLADAWTGVNNLLQGKGEAGMSDVTRFALNSTLGIVGLFDIASEAGLQKHKEDFGQTLGTWGVPSGPYLMLPLLGPSTVRDTVALPLDIKGDIWGYKEPVYIRNTGTALRVVDQRSNLLNATSLLEDAALDRYEFIRDGFLQRRENQIHPDSDDAPRKSKKDDAAEIDAKPAAAPAVATMAAAQTSAPVSSESAPKELNSGAPAASNVSP